MMRLILKTKIGKNVLRQYTDTWTAKWKSYKSSSDNKKPKYKNKMYRKTERTRKNLQAEIADMAGRTPERAAQPKRFDSLFVSFLLLLFKWRFW
jgi:hypothetical protein